MGNPAPADLVGRDLPLERLDASLTRVGAGVRTAVFVTGPAGIGKTSLVRAAVASGGSTLQVGWGTAAEASGTPGYWPWTQALGALVRSLGVDRSIELAGDDRLRLAVLVPALGAAQSDGDSNPLLVMDAATRWLDAVATAQPLLVVLDDLQWADDSTLALLDFALNLALRRPDRHGGDLPRRRGIDPVGCPARRPASSGASPTAQRPRPGRRVPVGRTDRSRAGVYRGCGGDPPADRWPSLPGPRAGAAARRHWPRVCCPVGRSRGCRPAAAPPAGVHPADSRPCRPRWTRDTAGRAGRRGRNHARRLRRRRSTGDRRWDPGSDGGRPAPLRPRPVPRDAGRGCVTQPPARRPPGARTSTGRPNGARQQRRRGRGRPPARGGDGSGGPGTGRPLGHRVGGDSAALAFAEAAGHLRRLRTAAGQAGVRLTDAQTVDILLAEAEALARCGSPLDAKGLLRAARDVATRADDARRSALVALATAQFGSRFAARRDDVIAELEAALAAGAGGDQALLVHLTAVLARELQHSVPEDRARAEPLSRQALERGRAAGDDTALVAGLLARHDVIWTPGTGEERAEIAPEIITVARRIGDDERHAQGLLLLANAELERGSAAYRPVLEDCLRVYDGLGQPRHRYTAETRRAAVALLEGDLEVAADRIEVAAEIGRHIREPDTGNVWMSQRLELFRARADPDELQRFAAAAVDHWTGAPVHAHAVAAGFWARSGDRQRARRHVVTVLDLGSWQADRSYLRSVFLRELAHATIVLDEQDLISELYEAFRPLGDTCAINGALVAFAGSFADTASRLAAALGRADDAADLRQQALDTYDRLGTRGWHRELSEVAGSARASAAPMAGSPARLQRAGPVWHLAFAGRQATVPHAKGLADLAVLLRRPGREVHVLELMGSGARSAAAGTVIDRTALAAYRQRLAALDAEIEAADHDHGAGRAEQAATEREALLAEVRRATTAGGQPRTFGNHPAERARKAVAARIRAAITTIDAVLPELADHLNRTIVTGTYCRYRNDEGIGWKVDDSPAR